MVHVYSIRHDFMELPLCSVDRTLPYFLLTIILGLLIKVDIFLMVGGNRIISWTSEIVGVSPTCHNERLVMYWLVNKVSV